jgi:creatinine amidohydrolase
MTRMRLANLHPACSWAERPWTEFDRLNDNAEALSILPVCGLFDHGGGLPLDAEETVLLELLRRACTALESRIALRVLPPLRFILSPGPSGFLGIDPDTVQETLENLADSVQAAGFGRLVFLNSSPWNEEIIDASSRDIRASTGLQTFIINLGGIGLSLHPVQTGDRARFLAVFNSISPTPAPGGGAPAEAIDADLRPGNWLRPPPIENDPALDGASLAAGCASRLAALLLEIMARPALGTPACGCGLQLPNIGPIEAGHAPEHPLRQRSLASKTRAELSALADKERGLVLIPTAAIEQHGPHLPVGVDSFLNEAWLGRALPLLPADTPVWIAPPILVGKSNEHIGFPGTLSITAPVLRRQISGIVRHLHAEGFRRFAVFNTHGGNSAVLDYTLRELMTLLPVRISFLPWSANYDVSPDERAYGFHAGEIETSLMLAVAPETVRMQAAVKELPALTSDPGELRPENAPATYSWITRDISVSGIIGDPTIATKEKGMRWLDRGARSIADSILNLLKRT